MDSVRNSVSYCCVWKGGRILYTYSMGDHEIENLAALCLETIPPYHRWYFETMGKHTYGFFMDEGFVYFAIICESLGNSEVLRFLHKLRDEFRRAGKRGSTRSVSSLDSLCLQEQLFPVVRHLVASLERVSGTGTVWPAENSSSLRLTPSQHSNANGHIEAGSSTKAPLLGNPGKQEKKKMKDHAIAMRDIETEEHRRSTDRGVKIDSGGPLDSNDQGTSASPLQKDFSSSRIKSSSQNLQNKWCRQVRIVLAIDAAICVVLFIIWLVICHGTECIR